MTAYVRRAALAATCAAVLIGPAAAAQAPGIEAYRATPNPASATLYRPNLPGPARSPFERADTLLERARAQLDAGNYLAAKRMLERSVRSSSNPDSRYLSAVAHAGLGETDDARRLFADALAVDGDHVGARLGLALTDIQLRRFDEAAAALAIIEDRRARCGGTCGNARELDRAARVIGHFLNDRGSI